MTTLAQKRRAVLAEPPALVLETPFRLGDLQLVGGPAPVDDLLGVEAGEVLADDLVGRVALDAARPRIPGATGPAGRAGRWRNP